jgi:hypothetical protein
MKGAFPHGCQVLPGDANGDLIQAWPAHGKGHKNEQARKPLRAVEISAETIAFDTFSTCRFGLVLGHKYCSSTFTVQLIIFDDS